MPTNTGNLGLTEPSGSDVVSELRLAIAANAVALGNADIYATGTISARPAAATGNTGMFYYATDSGDMSLSDGTTWHSLNGGLTTANLASSAGILGSQLASNAGIVGTQLAANTITASDMANFLQLVTVASGNATAGLAQFVQPYGGALIGTPGSPGVGCYFGVQPINSPTTVIANSGNFVGGGANGTTSFPVAQNSVAMFLWDGYRWAVIAGQQDTGWVPLTPTGSNNVSPSGFYEASARLHGDTVQLKGGVTIATAIPLGGQFASLPSSSFKPSATAVVQGQYPYAVYATGAINCLGSGPSSNGITISLDSISYSLS